MEIKFTKAETLKAKPQPGDKLGFGHIFTDYMLIMPYDEGLGAGMILRFVPTAISHFLLPQCVSTTVRQFSRV